MKLKVTVDYAEKDVVVEKDFKNAEELLDFVENDLDKEVEKALDPYREYTYPATIEFNYCLCLHSKDFNRLLKFGMIEIDGKKVSEADIEEMLDSLDE